MIIIVSGRPRPTLLAVPTNARGETVTVEQTFRSADKPPPPQPQEKQP